MNVNEVIANRAIQLAGGRLGSKQPIHPNDDVNMSQSSNDTFPTAMHIAAAREIVDRLLPAVSALREAVADKARRVRRHRQDRPHPSARRRAADARPGVVGLRAPARRTTALGCDASLAGLYELALGGTAVGTGLNAPPGFAEAAAARIAALTGLPFVTGAQQVRRARLDRCASCTPAARCGRSPAR